MNHSFDFKWIKARLTIGQVLAAYGLDRKLIQKKDYLYGPCPLHQGDNPTAFRVDLTRGIWRCFTNCGGGDIIELVRGINNCTYAEAAQSLSRLITQANTQSLSQNYLGTKNSFIPFTRKLHLNPVVAFLQEQKGILVSTAATYEAGTTPHSPFLKNMAAIRLHDLNGKPLGYCGRRLNPLEIDRWGKWRFARNFPKSSMLFNAHRAQSHANKGFILVECPWAAMRLGQIGAQNVIALLGTSISAMQINWIKRSPRILLLLDGDTAGYKAGAKISKMLADEVDVAIHDLPQGLEPEDLSDDQLKAVVSYHSFF